VWEHLLAEISKDMKPVEKVLPHATDEALVRRELELRRVEEDFRLRERDQETKERTVAVELERLEKERVEIQDMWEKVEGASKGLTTLADEKTMQELERRKADLDGAYLKLSEREEAIRKDEVKLEGEWTRLQSLEEELSDLAKLLKLKEEEIKKLEGQAAEQR
jgi:hypothetical protein